MDNSMAAKPYSRLKGDPYRAYEELPAEVRRALQESLVDWCPLRAREWHQQLLRERRLRPAQASFALVQAIRGQDHAEVTAFARKWAQEDKAAKGAEAYPHLAAGATLQRYAGTEGIPAAEPIPRPPAAQPLRKAAKAAPAKTGRAKKPARTAPKRKAGRRGRR